jgi:FeS assembly protein IscX
MRFDFLSLKAITSFPMTKLTWKDYEEIASALLDKYPDQDPLKVSFPKLHKMVVALAGFQSAPNDSNEKILETIQMTWYEEKVAR